MSGVAETARLAVEMSLGGNFNAGMAQSEASLARMNATASGAKGAASGLSTAFGTVETAAGKVGGALSHAGSQLKGLITGPLGMIGLGAGLLSVGAAIDKGIGKAAEWGSAIGRLSKITGDTSEQLSGLLAVTDRYGISADRLVTVAGFAEKAMGNIAAQAKGAAKFQSDFGFSILDSGGRVKDFSTLLLTFSDYYAKSADKAQAAAAAAKLFGRGYADLVPILSLGSAKIRELEDEAAKLGLTLTSANVRDLAAFKTATRDLGDAIGGLELQIGLALIPTLKDLATAASAFVAGHRGDIVAFFNGAVDAGKAAVGVIGQVAGTLGHAWESIPGPLRDFLVKGLVADRTIKFLFGFSPLGAAVDGLKGLIGGLLGRGSPANPMFVVTENGGSGPGGLPSGLPGLPAAGTLLTTLAPLAIGVGGILAAYWLPQILANPNTPGQQGATVTGSGGQDFGSLTPQQVGMLGNAVANQIAARQVGTEFSANDRGGQNPNVAIGGGSMSANDRGGQNEVVQALRGLGGTLRRPLDQIHADFAKQIATLKHGTDPAAIRKAADKAAADITKGVGSLRTTNATISLLRTAQAAAIKAGNTSLAAALGADLRKVEAKVPGRQYVERQIAQAQRIAHSSETANQKAEQLKAIQRQLVARGDAHAANEVAKLNALIRKKSTFTANTTVNVSTSVSVRDINRGSQTRARYNGRTGFTAI